MKKAFIAILIILVAFILNVLLSTGFFRKIENRFEGKMIEQIELPGVEDIAVSYEDNFIILSSDDRAARRDGNPVQGGLYYMDLQSSERKLLKLTGSFSKPFFPHGISLFRIDSAVYKLLAINHVQQEIGYKHYVEVFRLTGKNLSHIESLEHEFIHSPNDIEAIDAERFYFTNDHGSKTKRGYILENYLGLPRSNVVYFDGKDFKYADKGFPYANGIRYDKQRKLLFVASSRTFRTRVYEVEENGELKFWESINCKTGVDNIDFDQDGKIWIAGHPSLLAFTSYAAGKRKYSPSEIIKIDYRGKRDHDIEKVYLSDGKDMSASSVAIPFENLIFVGNVMDEHFIVLQQ